MRSLCCDGVHKADAHDGLTARIIPLFQVLCGALEHCHSRTKIVVTRSIDACRRVGNPLTLAHEFPVVQAVGRARSSSPGRAVAPSATMTVRSTTLSSGRCYGWRLRASTSSWSATAMCTRRCKPSQTAGRAADRTQQAGAIRAPNLSMDPSRGVALSRPPLHTKPPGHQDADRIERCSHKIRKWS